MLQTLGLYCCMLAQLDDHARPSSILNFVQKDVGYSNLAASEPLQLEDIEHWADTLQASENQRQFMRIQYGLFVRHHNELLNHVVPRYLSLSAEVNTVSVERGLKSREFADALDSYNRSSQGLWAQIESIEIDYLESILSGLTEEQCDRVYVLRDDASRRHSRNFPVRSRWVKIDLRSIWHSIPDDERGPGDDLVMSEILEDYELRVTPLLRKYRTAHWAAPVQIVKLLNQFDEGSISEQDYWTRYRAAHARKADAAARVEAITEEAVQQADARLSSTAISSFVRKAKESVFPELYPDDSSLAELFGQLTNSLTLQQTSKDTISELRISYDEEYKRVAEELEEFCKNWTDQNLRGVAGFQSQYLKSNLEPLLVKRNRLKEKWIGKIKDVTSEELIKAQSPLDPNSLKPPSP